MTRSFAWIGAGCACLFLVAGCTLDSMSLNVFGTARGDGPVVAGSLDVVSASTQKALSDMNLFVSVHRDGDVMKLTSTTPSGKRFTLLLKARKTDHGDETQVSIQWEKDADDAFWLQLAGAIGRPTPSSYPTWAAEGPPH